ncbi:hypothetical protein BYT27DRAFT_7248453 [Phlegmacium glaucopus]|nr:hypothetical protein BYT27DRAFT_7248453 [Phlegmacium glaucopus]
MLTKYSSLTINNAISTYEPTSTIKTSTADPMLSMPANAAAASAQVIEVADVTYYPVSTLVSTLAINDLAPVGVPAAGVHANIQFSPSPL